MYGQKFNPYGKFPSKNSQMYEEDYEQEESEPMIQEVDANYEPTDRQVREYAVQTLGMVLPEDEGLLYLAREGLKAPLPPNWVPYQSRDGEVYYKHRITQEKTYDHPTDIEYKKKYDQQKEKMARKNLKSMNMKASTGFGGQLGIAPNSNLLSNPSNLFPSKANNSNLFSGSSNLNQTSSQPPTAAKLDPKVEEQLEQELQMLQERLKKQWKEFEEEEREKHERKIKKQKEEHQGELERLLKGKGSDVKLDDKLRVQKQKIFQRLKQQLGSNMLVQLKEYQRAQESKLSEFRSVYQEDTNLKVSKYQAEKDHQFDSKQTKCKENAQKAAKVKQRKKKQREQVLAQLKLQFQNGNNTEIEQATLQTLQQELNAIRQSYANKIKEKEAELQQQYDETRRILGFDQNAYLSELASKKTRMKGISQLKIESIKKKQIQTVEAKFSNDYEEAAAKLKEKFEVDYAKKLAQEKHRQQQRLAKEKLKIDEELKLKTESQLQNVYDELRLKVKEYEAAMNRKLSTLSQKFIKDIQGKSRGTNIELSVRLQLKQKEITLQNKTQMISSLQRQRQLEKITHNLLLLQQQLYKCRDSYEIDMKLMRQAKKYQLQYRTQQYLQFEAIFKQMKNKYKKDKDFLASAMNSLQNYNRGTAIGSSAVLKQYNQDVRIMRENDQMLKKFQLLLKKAEINDKAALSQLSKNQIEYKDIQLKGQIGKIQQLSVGFQELPEENMAPKPQIYSNGGRDIDSALREHSKFLTTMRQQLNRKLYRLRGTAYY